MTPEEAEKDFQKEFDRRLYDLIVNHETSQRENGPLPDLT
jgi:hypothetical protein